MAYSGKSKRVKNALKTVLSAITYDSGGGSEAAFTSVLGTTEGEFDGYPALRILPGDLSTLKASVSQNDRALSYICRVHLPLEPGKQSEDTYDYMYDLTDLIIDALDSGDYHGALTTADPTIGTWILNATRGDWLITDGAPGSILVCDVNVEVKYTKDL